MSLPYLWELHKHAVKSSFVYLVLVLAAFRIEPWVGYLLICTLTMPVIAYIHGTNNQISNIATVTFSFTFVITILAFVVIAVVKADNGNPEITSINQWFLSFCSPHFIVAYLISCITYLVGFIMSDDNVRYFGPVYMPTFVMALILLGILIIVSA